MQLGLNAAARRSLILPLLLLLSGCTGVFFLPTPKLAGTPGSLGLAYRDVDFESSDGTALHGWFLPAVGKASGEACTVLFTHGNANNVSYHLEIVAWLPGAGINVFIFDYRGYGRSAGKTDLPGAHRDFQAALDWVMSQPDLDPDRVAVLGQSLGGAISIVGLARAPQKARVKALIVEGAFSDYRGIVREKLVQNPITWTLQWPFPLGIDNDHRPLEEVAKISPVPLLIIHGLEDLIVPPHHGEALHAAAAEPKQLWLLPAGHIESFSNPANRSRLMDFLSPCRG